MNSLDKMEEIDRLARLCEAKDADNKLLRALHQKFVGANKVLAGQLSEAQSQIAMQAEALMYVHPYFIPNTDCSDRMTQAAEELIECALSATSEAVAAWRAKETEPLRREVAMLVNSGKKMCEKLDVLPFNNQVDFEYVQLRDAMYFCKATALAYERGVENRGAVKALEDIVDACNDFAGREGPELGYCAACEDIKDAVKTEIAELRAANKGEMKCG